MSVSSAFSALTEFIGRLEATQRDVLGVTTQDVGTGDDDSLVVDLSVRMPLFDDIETDGIDLTARSASVNEDGTATVDLAVSIPRSTASGSAAATSGHSDKEATREPTATVDRRRNGDEPVHRDPDRLREVYAAYDTFDEMTEALGADVTPVTVRRNMIKHGIHEPRSHGSSPRAEDARTGTEIGTTDAGSTIEAEDEIDDDTTGSNTDADATGTDPTSGDARGSSADGSLAEDAIPPDDAGVPDDAPDPATDDDGSRTEEASAESTDEAAVVPNGIGLPDDLDWSQLTEIVSTSNTLHEAQTRLGLDRDRTRELLGNLGVLDLVHGRMSTRHERTVSPGEVGERIRDRLSSPA